MEAGGHLTGVRKFFAIIIFSLAVLKILAGCASGPESLYVWGSYEEQVFAHLSGSSGPHEQLQALENDLEKILTAGKRLPPGFYAHMGMLYAETGSRASAAVAFNREKAQFPESGAFMDILLERLLSPDLQAD